MKTNNLFLLIALLGVNILEGSCMAANEDINTRKVLGTKQLTNEYQRSHHNTKYYKYNENIKDNNAPHIKEKINAIEYYETHNNIKSYNDNDYIEYPVRDKNVIGLQNPIFDVCRKRSDLEYVKYLDYNNRNSNKYINSSLSDSKKNNSSDSEKNTVSRLRSKSVQIPKKNNQYDIVDSNNSSRLESDDAEIVNYNNIDYDNFSQDEETNDSDN